MNSMSTDPRFEQQEVSAEVVALAEHMEALVRGGLTLTTACDQLEKGIFKVESTLIFAAKSYYERKKREIQYWDDFVAKKGEGGVVKHAKKTWYAGPKDSDYFWPPLHKKIGADIGDSVADVDSSSSRVLSLSEAPGNESIRTRGLVLGYVQSGKTTNFMSVIAKAADAGYKLIIVLSGITDNLRQQTQARIAEYVVSPSQERFHLLTTDVRDFSEVTKAHALLNSDDLRLLAVVKKNPARLRRLNEWLDGASKATLARLPILVIDDEADQASIDVGSKRQSTINALIRKLLSNPKAAYIAYTATPFANLLIDPTDTDGLYPRDFVVNLPRPDAYFGPERIFGSLEHEEGSVPNDGLDIIRKISVKEAESVRPPRSKVELESWVAEVPQEMKRAVGWFLLATAARRIRDEKDKHSSMLIHTSMRAMAHVETANSVEDYLTDLKVGIRNADPEILGSLESLWEKETERIAAEDFGNKRLSFNELYSLLAQVVIDAEVIVDNYLSDKRLNYHPDESSTVIVVGGNTLSRGLTLEGLISSYFVRASSAYDTLLQMGRWFGYRVGYEDLVRIWMTNELKQWFMALSTVEAEIREDIDVYAREGKTPLDLPIKIRSHPQMSITSAAKMKNAVRASVSYSGRKIQTILFQDQNQAWVNDNQLAVEKFVNTAISQGHDEDELDSEVYRGFKNVDVGLITDFLNNYSVHQDARTINIENVVKYIEKQESQGALGSWNVVFIERKSEDPSDMTLGLRSPLKLLRRRKLMTNDDGTANLKAISSRWDRLADLDYSKEKIAGAFSKGDQKKVSDSILKLVRSNTDSAKNGLLVIYPINKYSESVDKPFVDIGIDTTSKDVRVPLEAKGHIIGISLIFPDAPNSNDTVDYYSARMDVDYLEDVENEIETADEVDEKRAVEESSKGH